MLCICEYLCTFIDYYVVVLLILFVGCKTTHSVCGHYAVKLVVI